MVEEIKIAQHGPGRREGPDIVLDPLEVHRILDADTAVVLRQDGCGNTDVPNPAVRRRRGKADRIQHGTAADGNT